MDAPERTGAFFGRRKGKRLRVGQDDLVQTLLPRLRVNPEAPAGPAAADRRTWLEIGFGGGEHLLAQARAHPDVAMVGCEPFLNGMAKLLAAIDREALTNVRVFDDDVTRLLPAWPAASIDRVSILYPEPWPKRRQRKRRLVSDAFLTGLSRIMQPGAELRFATDIDDYAGWTIARVLRSADFRWDARRPDDWRRPWADWPGTRYEAKALEAGRVPTYLTFKRI
ncbi:MAG: tRNA (guanine(46)-N(7))-methyltransferase TrmB [Microvirga sp.]